MLSNEYKSTGKRYIFKLSKQDVPFLKVEPKKELSEELQGVINKAKEHHNVPVLFVTPVDTNKDIKEVNLLKDDKNILVILPTNRKIDDVVIAHKLMHIILLKEGYEYMLLNVDTLAVDFVNKIVLDIIVSKKLEEIFGDDVKELERAMMAYNVSILTQHDTGALLKTFGANQLLLRLIQAYVLNKGSKVEPENNVFTKTVAKVFPFCEEKGEEILSIIDKYDIYDPEGYKNTLLEITQTNLFTGEIDYKWVNDL